MEKSEAVARLLAEGRPFLTEQGKDIRWNTPPRVADFDRDSSPGCGQEHRRLARFREGLDGVTHQIRNDPLQIARVDAHESIPGTLVDMEVDPDVLAVTVLRPL